MICLFFLVFHFQRFSQKVHDNNECRNTERKTPQELIRNSRCFCARFFPFLFRARLLYPSRPPGHLIFFCYSLYPSPPYHIHQKEMWVKCFVLLCAFLFCTCAALTCDSGDLSSVCVVSSPQNFTVVCYCFSWSSFPSFLLALLHSCINHILFHAFSYIYSFFFTKIERETPFSSFLLPFSHLSSKYFLLFY